MKKYLLGLMIFSSISAFATPYEIYVQQMNSTNTGYSPKILPVPSTNSILIYDPITTLATWVDVAANFNYSSGVLSPINCQSDWNAITGCQVVLNKPSSVAIYSGSTDASGNYTVSYSTAYGSKPKLVFAVEGGTNKDTSVLSSTTTTGFTIKVERRTDVLGLLPSYANIVGATVNVTVTP